MDFFGTVLFIRKEIVLNLCQTKNVYQVRKSSSWHHGEQLQIKRSSDIEDKLVVQMIKTSSGGIIFCQRNPRL
jgi:hypothetical protein